MIMKQKRATPAAPGRRLITTPAPYLLALLLAAPVAAGLAGTVLPAFGYLPALGGAEFSLAPFRALFAAPGLWDSAALSLASGLLATLVSLAAVLLFLGSATGTKADEVMRQILAPLLAVPHAAAGFGLAFLIAPSGVLFRLAAIPLGLHRPPDLLIVGDPLGLAMMAGLAAKETPFLFLVALAALPQADPAPRLRIARSLGYGRLAGFVLTIWPDVYRQIRLPVLAVAAFASSVVDVALILGPSTPPPLAVRLLQWMNDPDLSLRFQASAGALLQLALTATVLGLWLCLERAGGRARRAVAARGIRLAADGMARRAARLPATLAAATVSAGLLVLALWSFAGFWAFPDLLPAGFALRTWSRALPDAAGPLATSFAVAALSSLAALGFVVALLEVRRRRSGGTGALPTPVAVLVYLPLIVPQIAFVFGLELGVLVLGLAPSVPLLAAVHFVFVAPYVMLALAGSWFALDPRYERIGLSLGRSKLAVFLQIRLPMLAAPILAALAIGFAVSVGQYLPTVLIGAGRLPTITTEAVALAAGGDRRVVGAYALLQAALPFLAFALAAAIPALLYRRRAGMRAG